MDFGVGFLSNNVMLPFLDFFYSKVPSYGLAIIALTLAVRLAVFPLSAGSIRNARRMKAVNPLMQEKQKEIRERYASDPAKQQEELAGLFKEFGNPLAGCLPLVFQMPVLFALFATLRGSPFADVNYSIPVQVLPREQMALVQPQAYASNASNIYLSDGIHAKIAAVMPGGTKLGVGDKTHLDLQNLEGTPFSQLVAENPESNLTPTWTVTKGSEFVQIDAAGNLTALLPGEAAIQGSIPGLAASKGFLFIKALGNVGVTDADGIVNWDVIGLILTFGFSLYISQQLSGQGAAPNPQQDSVNRITPVIFTGMFFFFPLPAGVLMYMVIANIFQTCQTYLLMREPLPENIQAMLDAQTKKEGATTVVGTSRLPFEPANKKTVTVTATPVKDAKAAPKTKSTGKDASKDASSKKDASIKEDSKKAK
jgi:YidC/Oxa1 family membrane protein insertase